MEADDVIALFVACEDITHLRERRLQSERFEITFEATFADTLSANTSLTAVTEVEETFNLAVSVALRDVTATSADDRRCRHLRNCSKRCSFVNVHNVVNESLKNLRVLTWRHMFVLLLVNLTYDLLFSVCLYFCKKNNVRWWNP